MNKWIIASAILGLIGTSALADSWTRIKTEAEFKQAVVGKTLSYQGGTAKIKANGTGNGKTDRGKYVLNWVWDNGRYCRNFKFGNEDPTGTICAHIDVDGNNVRFSNLSGNKSVSVWTAK